MSKKSRHHQDTAKRETSGCAPLDPDAPTGLAFLALQRALLTVIRQNEAGILADLDPEPLHDFRVALRRSRVLHRIFRDQLEDSGFEALATKMRWLGRVTGPTRDLDVHLASLRLEDHEPEESAALAPLIELIEERRQEEWARLEAALISPEYTDFVCHAEKLLAAPDDSSDGDAAAHMAASGPPLRPWASRRIAKAYRRLRSHGRAIDRSSPDAAFHALRIDAKRLRYLIEFFSGLYRARTVAKLLHELERLQDNLGRLNDARVQQETLRSLARDLDRSGRGTTDSLLAAGRLVERADRRRLKERRRFEDHFARFEKRDVRRGFKKLVEGVGDDRDV